MTVTRRGAAPQVVPTALFPGVLRAAAILTAAILIAGCGVAQAQAPLRSSGCTAPSTQAPTSIVVGGRERALIVVPGEEGRAQQPHDLVLAFHGRTNSNAEVRQYYDLERHAVRPTVFVYPLGLPAGGGGRGWNDPGDPPDQLRDYALFDAIVLRLALQYCLDLGRVFAVGHSLGASFVNALACARGDTLRGVAAVAGGTGAATSCRGTPAAILLHNPDDGIVDVALAAGVRDRLIRDNGLSPARAVPVAANVAGNDLNCVRYGPADALDPVVWCAHDRDVTWRGRYYPHQWPRETGEVIMRFFGALP